MALIGPDGAGKTTVARALPERLQAPATYIYMGVNWEASNRLLPTTRLIRALRARRAGREVAKEAPEATPGSRPDGAAGRRAGAAVWRGLALANRLGEEVYRQLLAWSYVRRGYVVVFDRHFFSDYHAADIASGSALPLGKRVHGLFLAHVYPKPDLVVFLDAPADVLYSRKGEWTPEYLDRRRRDYLAVGQLARSFVVVDASRQLDEVIGEVAGAVRSSGRDLGLAVAERTR